MTYAQLLLIIGKIIMGTAGLLIMRPQAKGAELVAGLLILWWAAAFRLEPRKP